MYRKGCGVILHTEYVDRDDNHLKVIYKAGKHNHAGGKHKSYFSKIGLAVEEKETMRGK